MQYYAVFPWAQVVLRLAGAMTTLRMEVQKFLGGFTSFDHLWMVRLSIAHYFYRFLDSVACLRCKLALSFGNLT